MADIAGRVRRFIPRRVSIIFLRTLFGVIPDGCSPGRSVTHKRMLLATRYLRGEGIEIGAAAAACRGGGVARGPFPGIRAIGG